MIWQKIQKMSFVKQGAVNGFILGTLVQLPFLYTIYQEWQSYFFPEPRCEGLGCPSMGRVNNTEFYYTSLASCLIVALSCLVVRRLFAKRIKSQIVLWQIVGLISTIFFYIYVSVHGFIWDCIKECWGTRYSSCERVSLISNLQMTEEDLTGLLISLSIFLVFNLLFALALGWRKSALR